MLFFAIERKGFIVLQMQLVSLTAQILALRDTLTENGEHSASLVATASPSSSRTSSSPSKSAVLSTPPATPERPFSSFSFGLSPHNDLNAHNNSYDSMETFRLPISRKDSTNERRLVRRKSAGAASSLAGPVDGRVQVKRRAGSADLRTLCTTSLQLQD